MNMDIGSDEMTLFRDMARRAFEQEIAPHFEQWEEDHLVPRELWNTLGAAGLLCPDVDEAYGGAGTTPHVTLMLIEELSRMGFGGVATGYGIHSNIVAPYLSRHGTEAQKQQWLPKMVSGEAFGALAMTEPGAGSDVQGIRTNAVRDGDEWVLNGSKIFITNGIHADLVVVAAITDPGKGAKGTSLFLVDASLPGLREEPQDREDRPAHLGHGAAVLPGRAPAGGCAARRGEPRLRHHDGRAAPGAPRHRRPGDRRRRGRPGHHRGRTSRSARPSARPSARSRTRASSSPT
jgi:alkylation response protein AidB-like acyl-CoA dehydrogenase